MAREKYCERGNAEWKPELDEKVIVETQPMSDAVREVTSKFQHLFQGPYGISKVLGHSAYELMDEQGKGRIQQEAIKTIRGRTTHPNGGMRDLCRKKKLTAKIKRKRAKG